MPLFFKDKPLKEVLRILSEKTGVSIICEEEIEKKVTATFSRPTPLLKVLDSLLLPEYSYKIEGNFILIPSPLLEKKSFFLSYARASDLSSSLTSLLSSRGSFTIDEEANVLTVKDYPSTLKKIEEFIASQDTVEKQLKDKSFTLKYVQAESILPLVKEKLSPRGEVKLFSPTNTLLIRDTSYHLSKITPFVENLDVFKPEKKVFTLKYALICQLSPSISSLLSKEGKMQIDEEANQIIINDTPYSLKRISSFISSEDVPDKWIEKKEFSIKYLPLEEVSSRVKELLSPYGKMQLDKEKSLLTVSDTSFNLFKITNLIKEIDLFTPQEKTYSLKFAPLLEVSEKIKPLLSDKGEVILDKERGTLKVVDVEKNIKRVDLLVKEMDVLEKQLVSKKYFLKYLTAEEAKFFLEGIITPYGKVSLPQSSSNQEGNKSEEYIVIPSEESNNLKIIPPEKNEAQRVNFIYVTDLKRNISEIEKMIEEMNSSTQAKAIATRTFYIEKGSLEQIAIAIANLIGLSPEEIQGIDIKEGEWMRTTFQGGGPKISIKGVGE